MNSYYEFALQERVKWETAVKNFLQSINYTMKPVDAFGNAYLDEHSATIQTGALGAILEDWMKPYIVGYKCSDSASNKVPYDLQNFDNTSFINLKTRKKGKSKSGIGSGENIKRFYELNENQMVFMVSALTYEIDSIRKCVVIEPIIETLFVESIIYAQLIKTGKLKADGRNWSNSNSFSGRLTYPNYETDLECYFPDNYEMFRNYMLKIGDYK